MNFWRCWSRSIGLIDLCHHILFITGCINRLLFFCIVFITFAMVTVSTGMGSKLYWFKITGQFHIFEYTLVINVKSWHCQQFGNVFFVGFASNFWLNSEEFYFFMHSFIWFSFQKSGLESKARYFRRDRWVYTSKSNAFFFRMSLKIKTFFVFVKRCTELTIDIMPAWRMDLCIFDHFTWC